MPRILAALSRALLPAEPPRDSVHFHAAGPTPEVCYDAGCARPHLEV